MAESLSNVSEMIDEAIGKSRRLKEGILKAEWEKIVGKICEKCQPDYIKDQVLHIRVESPVFSHHISAEKTKYIQKVNDYFGEQVIKDIELKVGKLAENMDEYLVRDTDNIEVETEKESVEIPKSEEEVRQELHISQDEEINLDFMQKVVYLQKIAMKREDYLLSNGYKKCKICGMLYEGEEDFCKVCIDSGKVKKYLKSRGVKFEDSDLEEEKE